MTNQTKPRYLSKSRFKLAVECPTKLNYTGLKGYANRSDENEFLKALAKGGYQVGELAKLMYPGGKDIETLDIEASAAATVTLLEQENVTIYEAAICHDNLFIRIDILKKTGNHLDLIEVKAKSFDSTQETLLTEKGGIESSYLSYLQDVAFQKHVLAMAFPNFSINAFLMMADKSKHCTVDGLNQYFKVTQDKKGPKRIRITRADHADSSSIGNPILEKINVDKHIGIIWEQELKYAGNGGGSFKVVVNQWADAYSSRKIIAPMIGKQCKGCEFRTDSPSDTSRSGFHECWVKKLTPDDITKGTVFDLYHPVKNQIQKLLGKGIYRLSDITEVDLTLASKDHGISRGLRQWMQASGEWPGDDNFFLDREFLRVEMEKWKFPYHFIDFETSAVAIPFHRGRHPYEQVAFQFSHHIMDKDGTIRHADEFINVEPGVFPNYDFVRALMKALEGDDGTVFRWSAHENTVLNQIYAQLEDEPNPPTDSESLKNFIKTITTKKTADKKSIIWEGNRTMYDLCGLAKKCFFHPFTKGSSSIKKVLPAVLRSSPYLKEKYSQPIYGGDSTIPSKNFKHKKEWWIDKDGEAQDPYDLLDKVFPDFTKEEIAKLETNQEIEEIAEGGAAMTAYARLQFEDMDEQTRQYIKNALLRYCELDTLAMVMVVESWIAWLLRAR